MKGASIGAPAPCASTSVSPAFPGPSISKLVIARSSNYRGQARKQRPLTWSGITTPMRLSSTFAVRPFLLGLRRPHFGVERLQDFRLDIPGASFRDMLCDTRANRDFLLAHQMRIIDTGVFERFRAIQQGALEVRHNVPRDH